MHTQVAEMEFGEAIQVAINTILILIHHTGSTRMDLKNHAFQWSLLILVFKHASFQIQEFSTLSAPPPYAIQPVI